MSKKPEKETILCNVSDPLLHKLSRYEIREGIKRTGVYERAIEAFLAWYETQTPEQLKTWRVLSSTHGGKVYRGYVLSSERSRMQEIANELRHPLLDLFYTALTMLMEAEDIEKTQLIACFLDHSLYERCEQQVEQRYEERSDLVEEACTTYLDWYASMTTPPELTPSSYTGRAYQAYVSVALHQRLEEVATAHTLSPVDVFHAALVHHDQGATLDPKVVVTALLPRDTAKQVTQYVQQCQMTPGAFMEQALTSFLSWYGNSTREEDWAPQPASVAGEPFRGHVSHELAEALHALPFPRLDLYAHALRYYAHVREIHSSPALFADFEESQTATHGMAKVKLLSEQEKLIRLLIVVKDMRTINEFCIAASKWWMTRRHGMEPGEEEYFSRLSPSDDDPEDAFVTVHLTTPYEVHATLQSYAQEDSQSLRTVYYNAIIRYLDHILDFEDLSQFIDKMK